MNAYTSSIDDISSRLTDNPCRGIVFGLDDKAQQVQLAWIMGRSKNSQNRIYVVDGTTLRTEPADPSKVEDPSLILYNAMRSYNTAHVVSNGNHTDTAINYFSKISSPERIRKGHFFKSLRDRRCEPDAPVFTPRIIGYQDSRVPEKVFMSILSPDYLTKVFWKHAEKSSGLKKDNFRKPGLKESEIMELYNTEIGRLAQLDHHKFLTKTRKYALKVNPGTGYCLTTYKPGHETLDAFEGNPFIVPLKGSIEDIMNTFWNALEPQWRVSLEGKLIDGGKVIMAEPINKNKKVVQVN